MSRVVKLGLIGLVVFLVYRAITGGYESSSSTTPDEVVSETVEARPDPPVLRKSKVKVDVVVRRFVRVYYHRDARLFAGGVENADDRFEALLSPLVTDSFMDEYVATLDIPQNQIFIDGSYEQKAHVEKMSYHGHLDNNEADRSGSIVVTIYKFGEPQEKRKMNIEFLLEMHDGSWRIAGCTCDT